MSKIPIPTQFAGTLAGMNIGNMLPNPLKKYTDFGVSVNESTQSVPKHVQDYGISTSLFVSNSFSIASTSFAILLSYVPVYLLSKVSLPPFSDFCKRLIPGLRWSVPISLWLTAYLDFSVFAFLQLMNSRQSFGSAIAGFSTVLAGGVAALVILTPVWLVSFSLMKFNLIVSRSDEEFNCKYSFLFEPFRCSSHISNFSYFFLFAIRRLMLALTLVFTANSLELVAILNTSMCLLMFLYLFVCRPYADVVDHWESVCVEGNIFLVYLTASGFLLSLSDDVKNAMDLTGMWMARGAVMISSLFSAIRIGKGAFLLIQSFRAQQAAVQAKYETAAQSLSELRSQKANRIHVI